MSKLSDEELQWIKDYYGGKIPLKDYQRPGWRSLSKRLLSHIDAQAKELRYFRTKYPHPYPDELEG